MKRRGRLILILVACVVVALVVGVVWPGEREPVYKGKKLSEWVDIYVMHPGPIPGEPNPQEDPPKKRQAIEAACHMKDQILPLAVRRLTYRRPRWKYSVEYFLDSRLRVRSWCPTFLFAPFFASQADDGLVYFEMLGPEARGAVPAVGRILKETKDPYVKSRAMCALASIGEAGLGPLMEELGDCQSNDRRAAAASILYVGRHGGSAERAVPLLVKSLKDPDGLVASAAACVLGELAIQSGTVVPALVECLGDKNQGLRFEAVAALRKFGGEARAAVPELTREFGDFDPAMRLFVTNALREIAPEVFTNGVVSGAEGKTD